jgi:hypothetical protein
VARKATAKSTAKPAKAARKPSGAARARPLKDLSPAYRERIKRAARAQGISVAELRKRGSGAARGHGVAPGKSESQLRREREQDRIDAVAERQANKSKEGDAEVLGELFREHIKEHGMLWLRRYEKYMADLHARYVAGGHKPLGLSLDELADEWDLPREAMGYH